MSADRKLSVFRQAWPEEALASVAKYFLSGQAGLGIEPFVSPLGAMAVGIHRAVERETARSVLKNIFSTENTFVVVPHIESSLYRASSTVHIVLKAC